MTELSKDSIIAVIGAGAMGLGIAQVAAAAGHPVLVQDTRAGAAAAGIAGIAAALGKLVEKGKLSAESREGIVGRLSPVAELAELAPAKLVIEAVVEDLGVKRALFQQVESLVAEDAILATNTSSISITAIANGLQRPERLAGLHFFNPAPLMALVEVVAGLASDGAVLKTLYDTALAWGKSPVHAKSTPGFIVNRVARPYYAEALRIVQEQGADSVTIDAVAREAGGFRMGPFELMDLIGHDVNFAVTHSVWRAFFHEPRFQPSLIQQELVDGGWLGRKSGRGFYDYSPGAEKPPVIDAEIGPEPQKIVTLGELGPDEPVCSLIDGAGLARVEGAAIEAGAPGGFEIAGTLILPTDGRTATQRAADLNHPDLVLYDWVLDWDKISRVAITAADQADPVVLRRAAGFFQALGFKVSRVGDVPGLILGRTLAMLVNEAAEAVHHGVASAADVDLAMQKGVNYPLGPLAWGERIGLGRVVSLLDHLAQGYGEDRYRASALLRRKQSLGGRFHA